MRSTTTVFAVMIATLATSGFAGHASADLLNGNYIVIDGARYGGRLPVGTDKNVDAVRALIKAADAMGQVRGNVYATSTYLVIGDTSAGMRMNADGTWNGAKSHVVLDWDFRVPGVRVDVTKADTSTRAVTVAAINKAWDEKTPGVFGGKTASTVNERLILPMLTPEGVVNYGRDAADVIKLSRDGARDVLTIPLPLLGAGVNLVALMDTIGHPIHTSITYNGHTYTGDFSNFLPDRLDLGVLAPQHIVLQVDGKETANLDVNWHQANPYLVFPVPKEVAAN